MFSSQTENHPIFQFFKPSNPHSQPPEFHHNYEESSPKHSSSKKLNFEENDEIYVSEFQFTKEEVLQSSVNFLKNKGLMEIEEDPIAELKREDSLQTPPKSNKTSFTSLQVTVPPKYPQKIQALNETTQKTNRNIIGFFIKF